MSVSIQGLRENLEEIKGRSRKLLNDSEDFEIRELADLVKTVAYTIDLLLKDLEMED